jgi:plasmid stability protein
VDLHLYGKMSSVAKVKTTLSLDEHLLRQIRVRAARSGRRDSEVMEDVLREGLGALDRIRSRAHLTDREALNLASSVVHEIRKQSRPAKRKPKT